MKFCKCKFNYVFDHECDQSTAPCPNSAILKESTPSTEQVSATEAANEMWKDVLEAAKEVEQESQEELWDEAQNFVKNHLGTYSNDLVCDLARWAIEEMKKHYIITRKP